MRRMLVIVFSVVVVSLLVVTPALAAPAPVQVSVSPPAWGAARYHVVRAGETLFSIGRRYGVSPWAIASANHLYDANRIYAGQCLYIPAVYNYGYYNYNCRYYTYRYGCYRW